MGKYFGTDGIRGIANQDLSEKFARKAGFAIGSSLKACYRGRKLPYFKTIDRSLEHPSVLLGRDTRLSSPQLADAICTGLRASGVSVVDLGVVPTPFVGLFTNRFNAIGGVMVTASHNPVEYNGIKVFRSDGIKIGAKTEGIIESVIDACADIPSTHLGSVSRLDTIPLYIKYLHRNNRVSGKGVRVALDMAHGAACGIAEEVFSSFGFDVVPLCEKPNGSMINVKCGATDIAKLQSSVKKNKAHWGFALDGDADRVVAVDANGAAVNGDLLMALLALEHKPYLKSGKLVFTHMTNRGIELHLQKNGIKTYRTGVGDAAVLKAMRRLGALIGGEQSGHIICWDKTCGGDGILVALFVSELLTREHLSLAGFVKSIPVYEQVLTNLKLKRNGRWEDEATLGKQLHSLHAKYADVRLYIRSSGTEKLVRILTEAESRATAQQANDDVVAVFNAYDSK